AKTDPGSAFVERIEVDITDGFLDMDLIAINGKPIISAIEILTPSDEETSIGVRNYLDQQGPVLREDMFMNVSLFPNPVVSTSKLMINSEVEGEFEMSILDMQGREVTTQRLRKIGQIGKYILPIEELPAGMYLVRLTNSLENTIALKLVKPE
ncbi:MAG: T9SS type A sorting domain-containing protein, partial [Bacteroidota bacterium]